MSDIQNCKKSFASDNNSGIHPRILQAIANANCGHSVAYGDDPWTEQARATFKKEFGDQTEVFFVFNGTGANVTSLKALIQPWQSVICSDCAHINIDECGAPEANGSFKLVAEPSKDGKINPEAIERHLHCFGFEHHSQPGVVSITQATELGTLYSLDEIKAIAETAHKHGMAVHMDGARIANAAAALGVSLREATVDCGVDILSFGGAKNGLMLGEAVTVFNPEYAKYFKYIRKQSMQLNSKMRFVSAQFTELLKDGLWRENAEHSNAMAQKLAERVGAVEGVTINRPVETNGVFASLPRKAIEPLREKYFFYTWNEEIDEVRFMVSFDTTEEDIDGFATALSEVVAGL